MPRSPENQRIARKQRYDDYKGLCERYSGIRRYPWDLHYKQLRARRLLDATLEAAGKAKRPPMTAEQRALVGAEWCITCLEDCLPLGALGFCGFCSRIPSTGELIGKEMAA